MSPPQMFLFASKSLGLKAKMYAKILLLPVGEDGQPLAWDLNQAVMKIPDALRDGGYKVAPAYSILLGLCQDRPRMLFNLVLKN